MNRYFDSPFLLGFEQTRDLVERAARTAADSYPPYNVEAEGDGVIRISLAVAGFSGDQLSIEIEGNQLTVTGKRDADGSAPERAFLHRGIAARGFTRSFILAEGLKVESASLEHGLLHIDLVRPLPEAMIKRIPIRTGDKPDPGAKAGG